MFPFWIDLSDPSLLFEMSAVVAVIAMWAATWCLGCGRGA